MSGVKLVSVNIERSRHLDRVIPFLHAEKPDVICVQELDEADIPKIQQACDLDYIYCPFGIVPSNSRHPHDNAVLGVGIFARGIHTSDMHYYKGAASAARTEKNHLFRNIAVLSVDCNIEGVAYRIATTHFTWVDGGGVSDEQRMDLVRLQNVLAKMGEFVLTGDFNAPRGGEIFGSLASHYKDNIPNEYTSSIDGSLHRVGPLELMVDGIFSTPRYEVSNVRMQDGISDHKALIARVEAR